MSKDRKSPDTYSISATKNSASTQRVVDTFIQSYSEGEV